MKGRVLGRTIAVDLAVDVDYTTDRQAMPSPFEFLRSRLLPFTEPIEAPTMMSVILKTTTLGRLELGKGDVDSYLNPPVGEFDLLDWHRIYDIVEAGYRYSGRVIAGSAEALALVQRDEILDSRGIGPRARAFE